MNLLNIGDNVGRGKYRPHSVFKRVVNFSGDSGFVSVVTEDVGAGPINIVVDELPPSLSFRPPAFAEGKLQPESSEHSALVFKDNTLIIDGKGFDVSNCPVYNSQIAFPPLKKGGEGGFYGSSLDIFQTVLLREASPLSLAFLLDKNRYSNFDTGFKKAFFEQMSEGVTKLFSGDIEAGIRMIKGCGFGLTPSGDDFLAGVLLGMNLIKIIYGEDIGGYCTNLICHRELTVGGRGDPVKSNICTGLLLRYAPRNDTNMISKIYEASKGENPFTNAFLSMAAKGSFTEHFKRLVFCLLGDNKDDTGAAVRKVISHGETSGADMLTGFLMTLRKSLSSLRSLSSPRRRGSRVFNCTGFLPSQE